MQQERIKEQKYDEILKKQEIIIAKLQTQMEIVVQKQMQTDWNTEEIEDLSDEINRLQSQVNSSQYGGDPESELAEVERIQNQSLPKLQSMLLDLQNQLNDNNKNPFFKVFKQEGA